MMEKLFLAMAITWVMHFFLGVSTSSDRTLIIDHQSHTSPRPLTSWLPNH